MAYEKLKQELYLNVGGINEKASDYATGDNEVLSLKNLSFERPGAWTSRSGYSLYTNTSFVTKINGLYNYKKSDGSSCLIVSGGVTISSYVNGTPTNIGTSMGSAPVDFETQNDTMYYCDGTNFRKFDKTNDSKFSLPGETISAFFNGTPGVSLTTGGDKNTQSGYYNFRMGYLNTDGFYGLLGTDSLSIATTGAQEFFTFHMSPAAPISSLLPLDYGITALVLWQSENGNPYQISELTLSYQGLVSNFSETICAVYPIADGDQKIVTAIEKEVDDILHFTLVPKYIEPYNNILFMGGITGHASTTFYGSEGEPEKILTENFFETRTNNNDVITGYKAFLGRILIFKNRSINEVTGSSTENISQQEVTSEYGCISNKAIVTFKNRCVFLDEKGIAEYNGINTDIISDKIDSTFKRMNISVAKETAVGTHKKEANEIWFAIPLDSSTKNNAVVVYDYLVEGWTIYEGFEPGDMIVADTGAGKEDVVFGSYTGSVFSFGESLVSDNGATIACSIEGKYHKRLGDSTQEMWRRLYVNTNTASVTTPITVNFRPNYGTNSSLTTTMYMDKFQNRIDLGLSAKSMSVKLEFGSTTDKLVVNGYTIESRYLRGV
jgi:hypothetical protein